jgi:hypothetical protein
MSYSPAALTCQTSSTALRSPLQVSASVTVPVMRSFVPGSPASHSAERSGAFGR